VLLDINMPGINGIDVCRNIREMSPNVGIVMVSVREVEDDKVHALEAGADDYVTKPFTLRELTARLRAVLRRSRPPSQEPEMLKIGKLKMDLQARILWRGENAVHLSPTEFDLLMFMMRHPDTVLTHLKLLCTIWGPEYANERDYLRAYVRALRKKIEDDPARPRYILTDACVGYRFHDPSHSDLSLVAAHDRAVSL
jgi:two-component system KDP operon response regulator KdpE